jgi:thiol-disulfide isomerase/thioredoxin
MLKPITIVVLAALILTACGSDAADSPTPRPTYPTPAPVTFIPPTPLPPTITPTDPVVARPVPDVELTTLDGGTIRLRDLSGEIIFLNFWATWCVPCREEMPDLQQFVEDYGDQGVRVIAVTDPNDGQTEADVRAFVDEYDLTFTIALTSDAAFYRQFGVEPIPTTLIIDRAGMVRGRHIGAMHLDDMVAYFEQAAEN